MRTSLERFGRVSDIERKDEELGGFLTLFADLPPESQARVLQEVARLKREAGGNAETLLAEVKVLAEMYGAVAKGAEGKEKKDSGRFTVRLGEIEAAAIGLRQAVDPKEELIN
jgi:hypothetical protein